MGAIGASAFLFEEQMKKADPFYQSAKWQRIRAAILRRDGYICQYFKRYGKMKEAETVHHIFPREDFPEFQWESWNLIALSNEAHNRMHDRNTNKLTALGRELLERTARRQGLAGYAPRQSVKNLSNK